MTYSAESPKDFGGTVVDRHHKGQIEATVFHRQEMLPDPALQAVPEDRACRRGDHHRESHCQQDSPHRSESPRQEKH